MNLPRVVNVSDENITLVDILGKGASGSVYEGIRSDGSRVAVKIFQRKEDCQTEAEKAKRLDSKFAPKYYTHDVYTIVYELVLGFTLKEMPNFVNEFGLKLVTDTVSALNYYHNQGIAHGDISASNIMYSGTDLKIIDWGNSTTDLQDFDTKRSDDMWELGVIFTCRYLEDVFARPDHEIVNFLKTMGTDSPIRSICELLLEIDPEKRLRNWPVVIEIVENQITPSL